MDLAKQMNATAAHVARDVSEFEIAGLTAVPGRIVNVPRVAESPVSFECKLTQIIQLQGANGKKAQAWLTLGEVVAVHIDKALIKDGVYQTALAHPIVRAGRQGRLFRDPAGRTCSRWRGRTDLPPSPRPRAPCLAAPGSEMPTAFPEPERFFAVIALRVEFVLFSCDLPSKSLVLSAKV